MMHPIGGNLREKFKYYIIHKLIIVRRVFVVMFQYISVDTITVMIASSPVLALHNSVA